MRNKCRFCENVRKEGVVWYDDDYCSGKCKKADGGTIPPVAQSIKLAGVKASLEDYLLDYPKKLGQKDARGQRIKGRTPKRYRRRFEPEKLNWDEPLNAPDLKQAGFRANRKPIPGDYDYAEDEKPNAVQEHPLGTTRINKDGQPEVYAKKEAKNEETN